LLSYSAKAEYPAIVAVHDPERPGILDHPLEACHRARIRATRWAVTTFDIESDLSSHTYRTAATTLRMLPAQTHRAGSLRVQQCGEIAVIDPRRRRRRDGGLA